MPMLVKKQLVDAGGGVRPPRRGVAPGSGECFPWRPAPSGCQSGKLPRARRCARSRPCSRWSKSARL